jgi:hypothetical protein
MRSLIQHNVAICWWFMHNCQYIHSAPVFPNHFCKGTSHTRTHASPSWCQCLTVKAPPQVFHCHSDSWKQPTALMCRSPNNPEEEKLYRSSLWTSNTMLVTLSTCVAVTVCEAFCLSVARQHLFLTNLLPENNSSFIQHNDLVNSQMLRQVV